VSYTTWQEDFINDDLAELFDDKGVKIGEVRRFGGSWQVKHGAEVIAMRPDKETAQHCLNQYLVAAKEGA